MKRRRTALALIGLLVLGSCASLPPVQFISARGGTQQLFLSPVDVYADKLRIEIDLTILVSDDRKRGSVVINYTVFSNDRRLIASGDPQLIFGTAGQAVATTETKLLYAEYSNNLARYTASLSFAELVTVLRSANEFTLTLSVNAERVALTNIRPLVNSFGYLSRELLAA